MTLFGSNHDQPQRRRIWKDGYVFWGIIFGLMTGGLVRLWNSNKSGDEVREQIFSRFEPDHVLNDSMQEGKEAARRLQLPTT